MINTTMFNANNIQLEGISKIADHAQGQSASRFKSGAYTFVFEHFELVLRTP